MTRVVRLDGPLRPLPQKNLYRLILPLNTYWNIFPNGCLCPFVHLTVYYLNPWCLWRANSQTMDWISFNDVCISNTHAVCLLWEAFYAPSISITDLFTHSLNLSIHSSTHLLPRPVTPGGLTAFAGLCYPVEFCFVHYYTEVEVLQPSAKERFHKEEESKSRGEKEVVL